MTSTFLGLREFLFFETTEPAFENNLSDGVDVAGIHSHDLATLVNLENQCSLVFHQSNG